MSDLDYLRELIDVLHRAEKSSVFTTADSSRPLVCIRFDAEDGSEHDGAMLRIVDVEVVQDEIDAHVEIRVVPDMTEPDAAVPAEPVAQCQGDCDSMFCTARRPDDAAAGGAS